LDRLLILQFFSGHIIDAFLVCESAPYKLVFRLGGDAKASGGLADLDKAADLIKEWRAK
jgi:hypothetical protein